MLVDDISANCTDSLQTLQSQLSAKLNPYSPPSGLIASKCLVVNPMQLEALWLFYQNCFGTSLLLRKLLWYRRYWCTRTVWVVVTFNLSQASIMIWFISNQFGLAFIKPVWLGHHTTSTETKRISFSRWLNIRQIVLPTRVERKIVRFWRLRLLLESLPICLVHSLQGRSACA